MITVNDKPLSEHIATMVLEASKLYHIYMTTKEGTKECKAARDLYMQTWDRIIEYVGEANNEPWIKKEAE